MPGRRAARLGVAFTFGVFVVTELADEVQDFEVRSSAGLWKLCIGMALVIFTAVPTSIACCGPAAQSFSEPVSTGT